MTILKSLLTFWQLMAAIFEATVRQLSLR